MFKEMLLLISYWNMKPQGVGSSGKDLGLCGSPMRSKVNPLGANPPAKPEYYSIRMEGAFYLIRMRRP
jgi:hypothetical protein